MKSTAIQTYVSMMGKFPSLAYATLVAIGDHQSGCTEEQAHYAVASERPGKTAYSSVRSRFWELQTMGLIGDNGTVTILLPKGKTREHQRYALTEMGREFLKRDPVEAHEKMAQLMKVIHAGRDARAAACKPIYEEHNMGMRADTRSILMRFLRG